VNVYVYRSPDDKGIAEEKGYTSSDNDDDLSSNKYSGMNVFVHIHVYMYV
jgi:hypothetical protein